MKAKDEEYVKALQQQREEIEELLKCVPLLCCLLRCLRERVSCFWWLPLPGLDPFFRRMTDQYKELRDSYEIELEHIEDAFLSVRGCGVPLSLRVFFICV